MPTARPRNSEFRPTKRPKRATIYFLLTGAIWQGVTLIVFDNLVIGLVDNVLRPILVGKYT